MSIKTQHLNKIAALPKFGSGVCLHRLSIVMQRLLPADHLANATKIVVTGSDGKGSTAMLVSAILRASGVKTGLFTSPHFLEFNERFQIDGICVDYALLDETLDQVLDEALIVERELNEIFGVFEILFLVAVLLFYRQKVPVLVFEAGIGGRFDPVRALQAPLTALTSVTLEHTAILGDSTNLIAFDKLDACFAPGKTVVGNITSSLFDQIKTYSTLKGIEIIDSTQVVTADKVADGWRLTIDGFAPVHINTVQTAKTHGFNIQTAVTVCKTYFAENIPTDFNQLCQRGIEQCILPGRFEQIGQHPELFIDAAHTDDAFELLFDTIKAHFNDKPMIFITGISQGRDNSLLATKVVALACEIIVSSATFKGADPQLLFSQISNQINDQFNDQFNHQIKPMKPRPLLHCEPELTKALALAKQQALALKGRIFVVGGLFLAGEIAAIEKNIAVTSLYLY